jgi:hypothetical protein
VAFHASTALLHTAIAMELLAFLLSLPFSRDYLEVQRHQHLSTLEPSAVRGWSSVLFLNICSMI